MRAEAQTKRRISVKNEILEKQENKVDERPRYETPRVQTMTEKQILNSFQITQSMGAWWVTPTC
jgi:hypothetical protein